MNILITFINFEKKKKKRKDISRNILNLWDAHFKLNVIWFVLLEFVGFI